MTTENTIARAAKGVLCGLAAAFVFTWIPTRVLAQSPTEHMPYGPPITLEQARVVAAAADTAAKRLGLSTPSFAVVEPTGELVYLQKATNSAYFTNDWIVDKARIAARYRQPTSIFWELLKKGDLTVTIFPGITGSGPGGYPIVLGGQIIGAFGITSPKNDEIAAEALAALK